MHWNYATNLAHKTPTPKNGVIVIAQDGLSKTAPMLLTYALQFDADSLQFGIQTASSFFVFLFSGPRRSDCRHEDSPGGSVRAGDDDHQGARQQR